VQVKKKITLFTISMLLLIVTSFSIYLVAVPPFVDYGLDGKRQFQPKESGSIDVYYTDKGGGDGSFRLVLKLINCTFSNQTEKPYDQRNSTTVAFAFDKNWPLIGSTRRQVIFTIDDDVAGFAFELHLENISQKAVDARDSINYVGYSWNSTCSSYVLSQQQSVKVIS
jgi:hypothetical protein